MPPSPRLLLTLTLKRDNLKKTKLQKAHRAVPPLEIFGEVGIRPQL